MGKRFTFKRRQRLHRQRDFERIFARKCSVADKWMVLYSDWNDLTWTRLGIKVSRRHGNAVIRNRLRRILREAFRLQQHEIPPGLDVICIPRVGAIAPGHAADIGPALRQLINSAARKLGRSAAGSPPRT
jgi:ribonuclease P protein component